MVPKFVILVVFASLLAFSNGSDDVKSLEPPQPDPSSSTLAPTPTTQNITTTIATTTHNPNITTSTATTKPTTTVTSTTSVPPTTSPITKPTPSPTKPTSAPTTPKPTPSPSPSPSPLPGIGNWSVSDNNVTCILAEMAIQLNVTYVAVNTTVHYALLDVPNDAVASGSCGESEIQTLNLTWKNSDNTSNMLILNFMKDVKEKEYMIKNISVSITPTLQQFPSIKDNITINLYNNKTEFPTQISKSYRCVKEQKIDLLKNGTKVATADLSHVHLEAFHAKKDGTFGAVEDCESGGSSPDVVPIAVGCALVGLVAVVLIAYLVGRRRSQARGYLSIVRSDSENDIPLQHVSQWKKCWK